MKHINTIQQCLWFGFLAYYIADKFMAGGGAYSHGYALQVAIIVILTAIMPFYVASRLARVWPKHRLPMLLVAPAMLAMMGYALFFVVFIAPNYPDIAAVQVIVRGLLPGVVITVLLTLPMVADRLLRRAQVVAS